MEENINEGVKLSQDMTSQDILDAYGITEYTVDDIIRDFEDAISYKQEQARIFKILDAADHSDIWKVFNKKIPSYVQTPTHNPITIIKEATKASIMPTEYSGDFRALTLGAKELADTANKFFQLKWNSMDMDDVNNKCGEYAYLHGTSGVLFGWNNDLVEANDISSILNAKRLVPLQAKVYHPTNIFPDPSAATVEEMNFLCFAERKSKDFLKSIPRFQARMVNIENPNDTTGFTDPNYIRDKSKQYSRNVVTFITCYRKSLWLKPGINGIPTLTPRVDIIYMAGREILDVAFDIQPNCIPFVPLYDEEIPNNFWGISKCYKVLSLYLALIQLDSTEGTAYFKHQNPAEFINTLSGINIAEYQNKRNNPDAAYTVNCDPAKVQSFADRPEPPTQGYKEFRQYLISAIQQVSGVDAAYLGQSYGSIQTTGGVSQALDRSTMRDNNRIKAINKFIKRELELMSQFYMLNGQPETFKPKGNEMSPNQNLESKDLIFNPADLFNRDDIVIEVASDAPRSKQAYEDGAKQLMELQMKYVPAEHGYPDFITPDEMISFLNIPASEKNTIRERMKVQMENMKLEEYMAVLSAVGTLTQGGMDPEQALQEVVAQMIQTPVGQQPAVNPNPGQPMQK